MKLYQQRLTHYLPFQLQVLPDVKTGKSASTDALKKAEAQLVIKKLGSDDTLILLDEKGKAFSSRQFATWIEKHQMSGTKKLVFLIGGAFGFSDELYARANAQLSLSNMTFSHQMIRLFFLEQLYRANTILKNEPYHND